MQLYSAVMELYIFSSVGAVTPDLTLIIVIHQTSTGEQAKWAVLSRETIVNLNVYIKVGIFTIGDSKV